jgi:hypothetical protein
MVLISIFGFRRSKTGCRKRALLKIAQTINYFKRREGIDRAPSLFDEAKKLIRDYSIGCEEFDFKSWNDLSEMARRALRRRLLLQSLRHAKLTDEIYVVFMTEKPLPKQLLLEELRRFGPAYDRSVSSLQALRERYHTFRTHLSAPIP